MENLEQWFSIAWVGLQSAVVWVSAQARMHLSFLGMAWVASLLVVYGSDLMQWVKKTIGTWPLLIKLGVFVLISALGFGLLTQWMTPWLVAQMSGLSDLWLAPVVLGGYLAVGLLAQKKGLL